MRRGLLGTALLLGSCGPHPAAPPALPHYVVGSAYQTGGVWLYPLEQFRLDATGLATNIDRAGLTADGETWDPEALVGAHGTLQLPAVVQVTNLETGLQIQLRLIDRGPPGVHRLLGVSRRAGQLLGMTGDARVRMEVLDGPSQALREQLHGAPVLAVAAPREAVMAESLPPPGSTARPAPVQRAEPTQDTPATPAVVLPQTAERVMADPASLWIDAGQFSQPGFARSVASRLGGQARVEPVGTGRAESFRVRAGPYADTAAADSALDQALHAGVTDARIVVE